MNKAIFFLIAITALLSGCVARTNVTGGPTIAVPQPVAGGGGRLRQIFPPNNIIIVVNGTTAPIVLTVYQVSTGSRKIRLEAGEQTEITFRQLFRSEAVVVASIYDPTSGVIADTVSRRFYLTDDGGNVRTEDWVIRTSSSRRVIY